MTEDRKRKLTQNSLDRALKNAKREWATAKNAPSDVEADPHYHRAKMHYDRVEYYKEKLENMK